MLLRGMVLKIKAEDVVLLFEIQRKQYLDGSCNQNIINIVPYQIAWFVSKQLITIGCINLY